MDSRAGVNPIDILLVEDSPADVRLTQEVFNRSALVRTLTAVPDGAEALEYLFRRGPYRDAPRPQLVLLDLNLPGKDGLEVLAEIKRDPDLRQIPIIVLTTSRRAHDVQRSHDLQASCYLMKPVDLEAFVVLLHSIEEFWDRRLQGDEEQP